MTATPAVASTKQRIPLARADALVAELIDLLRPACVRIEVAGSVRRRKAECGDLELVCIPRLNYPAPLRDLFGNVVAQPPAGNQLDALAASLRSDGVLSDRPDVNGRPAFGSRYKRLSYGGVGLDLFSVVPGEGPQFGAIFTIRTGSAEFSKRLVTSRLSGGWMPPGMRQQDGALWDRGRMVETPEERDFLAAIGVPWIEPEQRTPHVTLLRNSAAGTLRWV